ncbi:hypothetical protein F5X98DRAFT_382444 [Xylaria grammica]|nr:hypothetical protein F5X98DRAFT_382444 [Xylaria grammica]
MANTMNIRTFELGNLWAEASNQLNGFVKTIKLTTRTFSMLGPDGEAYFGRSAASILNKNVEFTGDESNPNRIYLGNHEDIEQETNGVINHTPGTRLRVLRPGCRGDQNHNNAANFGMFMNFMNNPTNNHTAFGVNQSSSTLNYAPNLGIPESAFPTPNPIGSPEEQSVTTTSSIDGHIRNNNNNEDVVKQPPNAFVRFRTAHCRRLRQENPKMHQSEISASAKEAWLNMPAPEKARLNAEAAVDMEEFKRLHPNHFRDRAAKRKQMPKQPGQSRYKRQKTAQSSPTQHTEQNMVDQAAVHEMGLLQEPQPSVPNVEIVPVQGGNVDETQYEQPNHTNNVDTAHVPNAEIVPAQDIDAGEIQYEQPNHTSNADVAHVPNNDTPNNQEQPALIEGFEQNMFRFPDEGLANFSFEDFLNLDNFEENLENGTK